MPGESRFAAMARLSPVLPLIDGGHTLFQPTYVGDVAEAIQRALANPAQRGRTFELADPAGATLTVHLSADSRYVFYCNGVCLGRGPAKGDVNHHFYDTFDLTPHLRAGRNVLAAIVLDMSRVAHRPALLGAPCSVMTRISCSR